MFGQNEETKIGHFRAVAEFVIKSDPSGLTVTQKKALAAIVEKLESNPPGSYSALTAILTKKKATGRKTKPRKKPMDGPFLESIMADLMALEKKRSEFETFVDQLNKSHTAPEMKKIASSFAAGARPKTKADAVRILKAERNDRERAKEKADVAGSARPW